MPDVLTHVLVGYVVGALVATRFEDAGRPDVLEPGGDERAHDVSDQYVCQDVRHPDHPTVGVPAGRTPVVRRRTASDAAS